jgi:hypothetical protein
MNITIVGSRDFYDYSLLEKTVDKIISKRGYENITIVSGGAKGADTLAKVYAKEKGYFFKEFPAEWDKFGKAAGPIRNQQMALQSDLVIAFKKEFSKGTTNMIEQSKGYAVEVIVISI